MSKEIVTRCGYRCDLCLAYGPNIDENPEYPKILSDGWYRYFGFRIEPDKLFCDGCMASNDNDINLIDKGCPVRPCVIEKGLENCSGCDNYICDDLEERVVSVEELEEELGDKIPEEDYLRFIKPYENKKRFDKMK